VRGIWCTVRNLYRKHVDLDGCVMHGKPARNWSFGLSYEARPVTTRTHTSKGYRLRNDIVFQFTARRQHCKSTTVHQNLPNRCICSTELCNMCLRLRVFECWYQLFTVSSDR
jgi:hypothetical protein